MPTVICSLRSGGAHCDLALTDLEAEREAEDKEAEERDNTEET